MAMSFNMILVVTMYIVIKSVMTFISVNKISVCRLYRVTYHQDV